MQTRKILLTGGGTGGHIMPLLAVADELKKTNFADFEMYFIGPKNPFVSEFTERGISAYGILGSKLRRYFSLLNLVDIPKFIIGFFQALFRLYILMPDIVFSKSGPGTFPVILAARFYLIPVIIHESDAVPGLNNRMSAKFAKRIGVSFDSAAAYFEKSKVFVSGNPVRAELLRDESPDSGAKAASGEKPLIFIYCGSQGAARINQFVFDNLEILLKNFRIFHQTGEKNLAEARTITKSILAELPGEAGESYRLEGFLNLDSLRTVFREAAIVVSRSGSSIFEIAAFGKPAILIPLEGSAGNHQKANAYEYAKTGAAVVIEEANLKPNLFLSQLKNILEDKAKYSAMAAAAKNFARPDAAKIIAAEIFQILSHS